MPTRTLIKIKKMLRDEMDSQKVSVPALAKRMDKHTELVYRAITNKHSTKLEFLEDCFKALGKTLIINLVPDTD